AGTFYLDDLSAERRETASDIRSGEKMAIVDDANTFEWTGLHQNAPGRRGTIRRCSPRWATWPSWLISSDGNTTMPQSGRLLLARIVPTWNFTCSTSLTLIGRRKSHVHPSDMPGRKR